MTALRLFLRLVPIVLILGSLPGSWAGGDSQVAVVSRTPASIGLAATGFEVKPGRPVAEIPVSARDHQELLLELMAGPPVDRTGNGYESRN